MFLSDLTTSQFLYFKMVAEIPVEFRKIQFPNLLRFKIFNKLGKLEKKYKL